MGHWAALTHSTCYALYHVDAMLYHVLSNPRALSHLELRHDMPAANSVWEQETATAWAHRSLLGQGDKTARYTTAVRDCLSDAPVPETFASMDAYALSLVVSFILSSTRENSGWSTMSGQVCFERAAVSVARASACGGVGGRADGRAFSRYSSLAACLSRSSPARGRTHTQHSQRRCCG